MKDSSVKDQEDTRNKDGTWKKGVSGNPKGRTDNCYSLTFAAKEYLKANPEDRQAIVDRVIEGAKEGKYWCVTKLWEYMDGKPHQAIGYEDDEGQFQPQDTVIRLVE